MGVIGSMTTFLTRYYDVILLIAIGTAVGVTICLFTPTGREILKGTVVVLFADAAIWGIAAVILIAVSYIILK